MNSNDLHIEPSSPEPIYRQIIGQISRMVAAGQCPPGTRLPSVRDVAATHAINPMTVSKAYAQLEAQGLLERQRGKGMVVAAAAEQQHNSQTVAERLALLEPLLDELTRQSRQLDLGIEDVVTALRKQMENSK